MKREEKKINTTLDFILAGVIVLIAFLIVYGIIPPLARFLMGKGVYGVDVHKPDKVKIPEMVGLSIFFGILVASSLMMTVYTDRVPVLSFILSVAIAAGVGILDWFKRLGAYKKVVLSALACLPIIILRTYYPYPVLPFIGQLRLTILYPFAFTPLFIAMFANATNMMDVFNGSMAGSMSVSAVFLTVIALLLGEYEVMLIFAFLAASLCAFYLYNRYPAKVFSGDAGSLCVGVAFAAAAILGRMEIVTIFACLPSLMNGALILSSLGKFKERHDIKERPTAVLENGVITANLSRAAPITLTRLLVATSPLREYEITRSFILLHVFSGILAFITAIFLVM